MKNLFKLFIKSLHFKIKLLMFFFSKLLINNNCVFYNYNNIKK
jgi:hypothetical protein